MGLGEFASLIGLTGNYFANIHKFVYPLNDYHAFYLFWWFAWSIMIGQFTSRFVGGLRTYQVFLALLISRPFRWQYVLSAILLPCKQHCC